GHICIFLPKFHCEINFIRYLWGAVKRYLRENCDYMFEGLKENIQKAMASVPVELIRKWEHRVWRFIDAYADGLGAKDAQKRVKELTSYVMERTGESMDVYVDTWSRFFLDFPRFWGTVLAVLMGLHNQ
ncbi:hypothetical protein GGX14DRAFT_359245, partial [Mycena pura]